MENKTHKTICHDCGGNGYRRDCYGEVYQCKEIKAIVEVDKHGVKRIREIKE